MLLDLHCEKKYDSIPINIQFVRKCFNVHEDLEDSYIEKLLKIACEKLESITGSSVIEKDWVLTAKRVEIKLFKGPVRNVSSISVKTRNGTYKTIPVEDYYQKINLGNRIIILSEKYMDKIIKVNYSAGYRVNELPGDLESYILRMFGDLYNGNMESKAEEYKVSKSYTMNEIRI
ncbi:hypothetical protein [Candidatus Nesciobacter abundans]|uniref:Phage gp6-like head-tail connector protein n=1 Tax=Candidatus Nesciobacter abundans TaxID=2601668 RepID=A0A5C0UG21_9PROT|nr:hypothetical protein [Candidatus Nesciobacter abundans]QEK39045.1 hypothetical protein FZC36_01170 [Candidatus Nesciobacter abundans]